jgi:hypothetical protein
LEGADNASHHFFFHLHSLSTHTTSQGFFFLAVFHASFLSFFVARYHSLSALPQLDFPFLMYHFFFHSVFPSLSFFHLIAAFIPGLCPCSCSCTTTTTVITTHHGIINLPYYVIVLKTTEQTKQHFS